MADKISKLDAARRQIETAIELYFGGGDALPVYTHMPRSKFCSTCTPTRVMTALTSS